MKNSLRIHKWTHNEFNIFILGVLTHPLGINKKEGVTILARPLILVNFIWFHSIFLEINSSKLAPRKLSAMIFPFWSITMM